MTEQYSNDGMTTESLDINTPSGETPGYLYDSSEPLVFVTSYNDFSSLPHAPTGKPAKFTISVFRLHPETATLTLLSVNDECENPAFIRYHPHCNMFYTCTEHITKQNNIIAFAVSPTTGTIQTIDTRDSNGRSACYISIDKECKHLLFVNYWDSSIGTIAIRSSGNFDDSKVNIAVLPTSTIANDLNEHLTDRQSESHAHAIVIDPLFGRVAFVPDLGNDIITQYLYDASTGSLSGEFKIACNNEESSAHGPRYIIFHESMDIVYVVNELSSTVSVFEFQVSVAEMLSASHPRSTLKLIQTISTVPSGIPKYLNTCGRICIDPSGKFVLVSNRGHDSIVVMRISEISRGWAQCGLLSTVMFCHTGGQTPRHFQFAPDGRVLLCANQDSDNITLFRFDVGSGRLSAVGEQYFCPSPNFVHVQTPHNVYERKRRESFNQNDAKF